MIGLYVMIGAVSGALMVGASLFGTYLLGGAEPEVRGMFLAGWRLHAVHSLALLAIGMSSRPNRWLHGAFWVIVIGIVLGVIPLYLPAFGASMAEDILAPFGGLILMFGWVLLAFAGIHRMYTKGLGPSEGERMRSFLGGHQPHSGGRR